MFRLGIIGCGRMGRQHLEALSGLPSINVAGVVDPSATVRSALTDRGLTVFPAVDGLLESGEIDGVIVATPTDQHAAIVAEVAAAGIPILCEKPCGLNSSEIHAIAQALEAHPVPLQVAYWRRYVPDLVALHEREANGDIGDIYAIGCYQWDERPPSVAFRAHSGGIFIDMGVHEIDEMRWLTGQD